MSRSSSAQSWKLAELPWLARVSLWLVVVMGFANPSCLITSTPQFPESRCLTPFLRVRTPKAHQVLRVNKSSAGYETYEPVTVTFEVYSKDVDDTPLLAWFVLDWQEPQLEKVEWPPWEVPAKRLECNSEADGGNPASPFSATYGVGAQTKPGCHSLTLFVSRTPRPAEAATATWWLDVDDPADNEPLSNCPGAARGPSGVDGGGW
jgi:hypothetical protein